jgi:hypothetical protein
LWRIEEKLIGRAGRPATAQDHMHRTSAGIYDIGSHAGGLRRQRSACVVAADRVRTLIVMLVPADHQVDLIAVEQRQPFFANAEIRAVELVGSRDRDLMHADDDPVDRGIRPRRHQGLFQPSLLRASRIASDIGIAAVLITNVVIGEADDANRAGGEAVPETAGRHRLPVRIGKTEVGLVSLVADRSVAELILMIAGRWHPRPIAGAAAVVGPEIGPCPHPVLGEIGIA